MESDDTFGFFSFRQGTADAEMPIVNKIATAMVCGLMVYLLYQSWLACMCAKQTSLAQ